MLAGTQWERPVGKLHTVTLYPLRIYTLVLERNQNRYNVSYSTVVT